MRTIITVCFIASFTIGCVKQNSQNEKSKPTAVEPKVATVSIKYGEQHLEERTTLDGKYKYPIYRRDIFIHNSDEFAFEGIELAGFTPILNTPNEQEILNYKRVAADIDLRLNDLYHVPFVESKATFWRGLPSTKITLRNKKLWAESKVTKLKVSVEMPFRCTKEMAQHRVSYHITLAKIYFYLFDKQKDQEYKDFFVINCGEHVPIPTK